MDKSTVTDLPRLAAPAERAFASVGINKLEDLARFTEDEIIDLRRGTEKCYAPNLSGSCG